MTYKYYIEVESNIHFQTSKEIAEFIGIYSVNKKPHTNLVRAYFLDNKLKYAGEKGMTNVYSDFDALIRFCQDLIKQCKTNEYSTFKINGKEYTVFVNIDRVKIAMEKYQFIKEAIGHEQSRSNL
jgi:hypothetical protein|nr:MAG TPA: protein of unknown function (DUF4318) [Caudoviricetes sp.]